MNNTDIPYSFKTLSALIRDWAKNRGILDKASVIKQLDKAQEELNETRDAAVRLQQLNEVAPLMANADGVLYSRAVHQLRDGFGDTLVCLINAAALVGLDLETCLHQAYNEIKDRKGQMVNGKFVKES